MSAARTLRVAFLERWHCGTGIGGGFADARIDRDADGLPFVPGRHLRGVLRDAALRAERWGAFVPGTVEALFGGDPAEVTEVDPHALPPRPEPGRLRVGSARLAPGVRGRLLAEPALRLALTDLFAQTAVDPESGTARSRHLRRMELAVPLTLYAAISWTGEADHPLARTWADLLAAEVFPLVFALGADRTRGLGRVELSWVEER